MAFIISKYPSNSSVLIDANRRRQLSYEKMAFRESKYPLNWIVANRRHQEAEYLVTTKWDLTATGKSYLLPKA